MPLSMGRVEVDHLQMIMKCLQNDFAGYPNRERSDSCENGSRHVEFCS